MTVNGTQLCSQSHDFTLAPANWTAGAGYFDHYVRLWLTAQGCTTVQVITDAAARQPVAAAATAAALSLAPEPTAPFAIPLLSVDKSTRGDWIGSYGRAGYILFGWQGDTLHGSALTKLPPGVGPARFGVSAAGNATLFQQRWDVSSQPARAASALLDPTDKRMRARRIGAAHTESFGTSTIDVPFDGGTPAPAHADRCWNVTFYFCDFDGNGSWLGGTGSHLRRRQALDLFLLPDFRLGYSTAVQDDFSRGVYVTFRACRSFRARLYPIFGDNAVVGLCESSSTAESMGPPGLDPVPPCLSQ